MIKFKCDNCGKAFEDKGKVLEYNSPVYGPCSKKIAGCPECGHESDEYRPPKQAKSRSAAYSGAMPSMGGCSAGGGGCCCSGQG